LPHRLTFFLVLPPRPHRLPPAFAFLASALAFMMAPASGTSLMQQVCEQVFFMVYVLQLLWSLVAQFVAESFLALHFLVAAASAFCSAALLTALLLGAVMAQVVYPGVWV